MDDPNIMIGKIGKRKGVRANLNWKAYNSERKLALQSRRTQACLLERVRTKAFRRRHELGLACAALSVGMKFSSASQVSASACHLSHISPL